jgi:hypothetical protein
MTKPTSNDHAAAEQSDVVLFGLDETGKPRAARFSGEHTDLAAKAAGLMNLTICYANSAELATIAQQLPAGRIHANGRGLVPNVRRDLYDKLTRLSQLARSRGDFAGLDVGKCESNQWSAPGSQL